MWVCLVSRQIPSSTIWSLHSFARPLCRTVLLTFKQWQSARMCSATINQHKKMAEYAQSVRALGQSCMQIMEQMLYAEGEGMAELWEELALEDILPQKTAVWSFLGRWDHDRTCHKGKHLINVTFVSLSGGSSFSVVVFLIWASETYST